jgi:hypothetical protein
MSNTNATNDPAAPRPAIPSPSYDALRAGVALVETLHRAMLDTGEMTGECVALTGYARGLKLRRDARAIIAVYADSSARLAARAIAALVPILGMPTSTSRRAGRVIEGLSRAIPDEIVINFDGRRETEQIEASVTLEADQIGALREALGATVTLPTIPELPQVTTKAEAPAEAARTPCIGCDAEDCADYDGVPCDFPCHAPRALPLLATGPGWTPALIEDAIARA